LTPATFQRRNELRAVVPARGKLAVPFPAVVLVGVMPALRFASVWDDAPVFDQAPHIGAGYNDFAFHYD